MSATPDKATIPQSRRRWYQLHRVTWLGIAVIGFAAAYCNSSRPLQSGRRQVVSFAVNRHLNGNVYRRLSGDHLGWPFVYTENTQFYISNAFFSNVFIGCIVLTSVGFVLQKLARCGMRFSLAGLLAFVGVIAVLVELQFHFDINGLPADFLDRGVLFSPTAFRYPWYVWIPVTLGLGCTIYSAFSVVKACLRLVLTATFGADSSQGTPTGSKRPFA